MHKWRLKNSIALNKSIRKIFNRLGFNITRYRPEDEQDKQLYFLKQFKIDTILDIGANKGQYAIHKRDLGFKGKIVSFEPELNSYQELVLRSKHYEQWQVENTAIGNFDGEAELNIAGNSYSSSILDMLPLHENAAPESAYIAKQKIKVNKLDTIFENYCTKDNSVLLKIDTQGFEMNVLKGAKESLSLIKGIQLEMSIFPLYKDEILFLEMVTYIQSLGFKLYIIESGFCDAQTGQLLQVEGVFYR